MKSSAVADLSSAVRPIPKLPNELLLQIFEAISNDYDEQCRTFSALARVCHQFFRLVTPLLYRSFEHCCDKHLYLFARTIFATKDRATLVEHFKGRKERIPFDPILASCNDYSDDEDFDEPAHAALKFEARRRVPVSSREGSWWQFIAFSLTCVCPNMQWLDVTDCASDFFARLCEVTAGKTMKPETAFERVNTLTITIGSMTRSFHVHDISLLFRLASLRSLTFKHAALSGMEEEFWSSMELEYFWKCDWQSSPIEKITLEECSLPLEWIIAIIISCKALKHFHLEYFHRFIGNDLYPGLFSELANHQDSLVSLQINELDGCRSYSLAQSEPDEPISFGHYKSLTLLDIPLFLLSTKKRRRPLQSIFPPTLQILTLGVKSSREGFSDAFFIDLAESSKLEVPSLSSVKVVCRIEKYNRNGYLPLHFCHIHRMFSSHGVGFVYALEFVSCEFRLAYMESILKTLRNSGPDGSNIADHSSFETGCPGPCNNRSPDVVQSKERWGYMQPWTGPDEFADKVYVEGSIGG